MSKELSKFGDDAMYESRPMLRNSEGHVEPRVFLLSATSDPLGAIAAAMRMFRGDPPYRLADVTDEERRWAWEESIKGHLKAPWEMVDFQFMLEGVTRAFTHQLVRQRTAVYAQESLRFAVKEGFSDEVPMPISVQGDEQAEAFWKQSIKATEKGYDALVNMGVPAEDARGLLPHAVTTRVIYKTTLRGLLEHAGNRLCTQAQFEWRAVFLGIIKAIRTYGDWQFELIAKPIPETFAPVCYQKGRCPFMSELDRGCAIRSRVEAFHAAGIEPRFWHASSTEYKGHSTINPLEWLANPRAGVTDPGNRRPE
jgi:flavin-dependent thymidylate synthase